MSVLTLADMQVTRGQIIARGLTNCCPNCGERGLFVPGSFFQINKACSSCGLTLERGEGFFLGSMSLNYGFTVIGYLTPLAVLAYVGVIGLQTAAILGGVGALVLPIVCYRASRSWWLMNYYFFLPQHLPANQEGAEKSEM